MFVAAVEWQAARQDRRGVLGIHHFDVMRGFEPLAAGGLTSLVHRPKQIAGFVPPGKPAAVVRVPRIGLRLFDGVELDVHREYAAASPDTILLHKASQLLPFEVQQTPASDNFAERGRGRRCLLYT